MSLLARNIDAPIIWGICEERRGAMDIRQASSSVCRPFRDASNGTGAVLESGGEGEGTEIKNFSGAFQSTASILPSFHKYMLSICVPGSVSGAEDPAAWSMISLPSVTVSGRERQGKQDNCLWGAPGRRLSGHYD